MWHQSQQLSIMTAQMVGGGKALLNVLEVNQKSGLFCFFWDAQYWILQTKLPLRKA